MEKQDFEIYKQAQSSIEDILQNASSHSILPSLQSLSHATSSIQLTLPDKGHGLEATAQHLLHDIIPGLTGGGFSPTYYGFVTGGSTPAARLADNLVTLFDENTHAHLPKETVATLVQDRALCLLLELLDFEPQQWPGRTFTTGATASNVLGLACGREFAISQKLAQNGQEVREGEGLLSACRRAGIHDFQVLTTLPHSSLRKAANIVGLGSASMIDVAKEGSSLEFDLEKLERCLAAPNVASIVAVSCGEVNTGAFATNSLEEVTTIRTLCDRYGAWLHVDGAFGMFVRTLPQVPEYTALRNGAAGMHLVDSIAGDGHKLLNVPYDCGFFFSRHLDIPLRVFSNPNAAYLKTSATDGLPSPLNIRIENSGRFRGLPVYASLLAYGKDGYSAMVVRMVELARKVARWIRDECEELELLPTGWHNEGFERVYMCIMFRAKNDTLNDLLVDRIKTLGKVYGSGTIWEGKPATRFAIAKWNVDVERDFAVVKEVLTSIISSG